MTTKLKMLTLYPKAYLTSWMEFRRDHHKWSDNLTIHRYNAIHKMLKVNHGQR